MNVDQPQTFYNNLFDDDNDDLNADGQERIVDYRTTMDRFRKFIREFSVGGFNYKYREQLKRNYQLGEYCLEIEFADLKQFDEESAMKLRMSPAQYISALETAAKEIADLITSPRAENEKDVQDIQVIVILNDEPTSIRRIKSTDVSKLVKISGIIVASSQVRARATKVTLQCRSCRHTISNVEVKAGLEGFQLPRMCSANQAGKNARCPLDPYFIVPDKCSCTDFQTLKLQETPEDVPHGEMPRHMQLYVDRYLTDRVVPGNRVTITGILSIKRLFKQKGGKANDKAMSGIRLPYIKVTGIQIEMTGAGRSDQWHFAPEDERKFRELAKSDNVYEMISKSIAPSIYGSEDIKKAIACLLFGGSRKRLPDGLTRRGDINVLLLGDPGTAKSQLLKFVEKVSPIAVYTSGKGSSAAGLTASIIRDPQSRSFIMEGGAMVLADGGVVCIDEFDKMREDDRVAIHEAMEQQTISIAKAGITTTLNSRCSVLAAANSVFGRWDDNKGEENIDFMPTILSRFDAIFVVKDTQDAVRDATLAKHVISVHMNADQHIPNDEASQELSLEFLKKYVAFARANCAPRLCDAAKEKLLNNYVKMRNPESDITKRSKKMPMIPITVRQLEAIIRMSEALAKMELQPFALERHVDEAVRLFSVSTLQAAESGELAGIEGFMSNTDQATFNRIENQLRKRFSVGSYVSVDLIVGEFIKQGYDEAIVRKVIHYCISRGLMVYKYQRKMLYRIK
uniref:DNA replication licensing factor MCM5 n=1 Tax=Panagrolaimus sp. JU765 TaxID=591449 RepID=A0AC34QA03_9BILA